MIRLLLITILVSSCSTARFERTTAPENDAFLSETTIRFDGKRLNEWAQEHGLLGEATRLCQSNETQKGQEILKSNLNSMRKYAGYWLVVGNCHWYDNQSAKAEYFYRLALSIEKKNQLLIDALHNNIGLLYMQRSLFPEARSEFEKAKESLTARYNLAQISILIGDTRSAKKHLGDIYRINRKDPDVLASMAVTHLLDGNAKLALNVLGEIPKNESDRQDIAFYRAMGLFLKGEVELAQKSLEGVSRADSKVNRLSDMAKELEKLVSAEVERRLKAQAADTKVEG